MTTIHSGFKRIDNDHFHPEGSADPAAQRRLRGHLEQIDYTAFACNQAVVAKTLGKVGPAAFQSLALACSRARAAWVAEGFKLAETGDTLESAAAERLHGLRKAYEELAEVYEAARRMVDRGYLIYEAPPSA